jgi:hypothetical protein
MKDEPKMVSLLPKLNASKTFAAKAIQPDPGVQHGEAGFFKKDTGRRGTELRIVVLENYAHQRIHRLVEYSFPLALVRSKAARPTSPFPCAASMAQLVILIG